jgi:hypothetical protein
VNNLQLYVGKDDCIRQIQKKFSELFPHLWISLFRHSDGHLPNQDILYTGETQIADVNPVLVGGKLEIDPHMTVAAFESAFYNQFGLYVEVAKKRNEPGDSGKLGIDQCALDDISQDVKEKTPVGTEAILFRDVPFGC